MNPLLILGALGVGAYLLMSSSSSGAGVSAPPTNAYGGGGAAPGGSGGYGGPTTLGPGGSSTPVGPAAVSTSPSTDSGGGYGGPVSSSAPAPTYMTDETLASFPNLATGAGQGMSSYGGVDEDETGGFPAAGMSGTAAGPPLRWDPMSRSWY